MKGFIPSTAKTVMTKGKVLKRIEVIDVAKCIAIIMVIYGHTCPNDVLTSANPPMYAKVLYSIHMPLFFFLSGLTISLKNYTSWEKWRYFLRKNILTVAIPYFIWCLIYCTFNYKNVAWIFYGSWYAIGQSKAVTSLWYLSCLFLSRIMVQLVISVMYKLKKGENRPAYIIPAVLFFIIGIALPDINIGYPWCLNVAFVASGCMLLGIVLKYLLISLQVQKEWILLVLLIASISIYCITVYFAGDNFICMMMCKGYYGNPILAFILAVLGGFAVLITSMILKRLADEWLPNMDLTPMIYLGQHTMGIFLLHKPILQNLILPFFENLMTNAPGTIIRIISTVITLIISMVLCNLIEYYIPELVGIFSKDKIEGNVG